MLNFRYENEMAVIPYRKQYYFQIVWKEGRKEGTDGSNGQRKRTEGTGRKEKKRTKGKGRKEKDRKKRTERKGQKEKDGRKRMEGKGRKEGWKSGKGKVDGWMDEVYFRRL